MFCGSRKLVTASNSWQKRGNQPVMRSSTCSALKEAVQAAIPTIEEMLVVFCMVRRRTQRALKTRATVGAENDKQINGARGK